MEKNRLNVLIKQLEHKLCIPLLICAQEVASEEDFYTLISTLEKVVFRYISVSNLRANKLSQIYNRNILSMRRANNFDVEVFKNDCKDLIQGNCDDEMFEKSLIANLTYQNNNRSRKKLRYFLSSIEDYNQWYNLSPRQLPPVAQMQVQINIDSVDIEHIYPQNAPLIIDELEEKKHQLGNLTFWSPRDNKSASNSNFQEKLTFYSTSNISITRSLTNFDDWNLSSFSTRERDYLEMAKVIFYIY